MPMPRKDISAQEMAAYLKSRSDLRLELQALHTFQSDGYACEHGGTYEDPVTKQPRQFDLRARQDFRPGCVYIAAECKSINDDLVISCLPRRTEESFHTLLHSLNLKGYHQVTTIRVDQQFYPYGSPTGKCTNQLFYNRDGGIESNDKEIYEKWSQAISSAFDLVYEAFWKGDSEGSSDFGFILPVVVVPDKKLWTAEFDNNGELSSDPKLADRCPFYVNKEYDVRDKLSPIRYSMSHVEFVTISWLPELLDDLKGAVAVGRLFPPSLTSASEAAMHGS